MPIGVGKDVLAQVMADEAIDAENENMFQDKAPNDNIQVNAGDSGQRRQFRSTRAIQVSASG
jgi:hypothetical protein